MTSISHHKPAARRRGYDRIDIWQADAECTVEDRSSTGIIALLFDSLTTFLKLTLNEKGLQCTQSQALSLKKDLASLYFWGADLGVLHGDLDNALQHSALLRDTLLAVLISLGDFCIQGWEKLHCVAVRTLTFEQGLIKFLPAKSDFGRESRASDIVALTDSARSAHNSTGESGNYGEVELSDIAIVLHSKVKSLLSLSASLECPAEDDDNEAEAARDYTNLGYHSADRNLIEQVETRFPKADRDTVESLGRLNWIRYIHLLKQREHTHEEVIVEKAGTVFHDSGLGSSALAESVVHSDDTMTVVSRRARTSHKRLPPLPAEARLGQPFDCEVCGRTIRSIRRTREWK